MKMISVLAAFQPSDAVTTHFVAGNNSAVDSHAVFDNMCSMNVVAIIERVKDTRAPFYRPELPLLESEGIQPGVETLMKQCWAEEPSERPSFDAILKSLKVINKGKLAFLFIYNCILNVLNCFIVLLFNT